MTMNYYVSGENVNGRPCRGVVHVVKKGDTLYKISRVYDVKVADLIWMNPGVRIYNLQVGDKICVPVSSWEMPDADEELQKLNEDISPAYAEGTVLNIPSNRILRRRQEAQ